MQKDNQTKFKLLKDHYSCYLTEGAQEVLIEQIILSQIESEVISGFMITYIKNLIRSNVILFAEGNLNLQLQILH